MQREISLETSTRARERPCNSISRCKNDEWMIGRVKLHSTVPTQANSFGLVVAKRRTLTTNHVFFAICDSSFFSICIALVCGNRFWTFCTGNIYPKRHIFQGTDMDLETIQFSEWLTFKKQFFSFFKKQRYLFIIETSFLYVQFVQTLISSTSSIDINILIIWLNP